MFLDLPVELRLRIAEYALEQRPAAGIPLVGRHLQRDKGDYKPSENLALLLVCRQFRIDFTDLAYRKTRFRLLANRHGVGIQRLPLHRLQNLRKLAYNPDKLEWQSWGSYVCNLEPLRLDELVLFMGHGRMDCSFKPLILFMRRLLHVKTIKYVLYELLGRNRSRYCSFIGAIMKEDHFQRYDAPGAPNVEATWWDWRLNPQANIITFQAQTPRPILSEEEYMLLMKPKVDALMAEAERAAGL